MAKKNGKKNTRKMPKKKWLVKKRFQEGDRVYMPGDEYAGINAARLEDPSHAWRKAGWVAEEAPSSQSTKDASDETPVASPENSAGPHQPPKPPGERMFA